MVFGLGIGLLALGSSCSDDGGAGGVGDTGADAADTAGDGGDLATDRAQDGAETGADAEADGDAPGDADFPDFDEPLTCVAPEGADPSGTDELEDAEGSATVVIADRDSCYRSYTLSTTASLRDDLPANPRSFGEEAGWPTLRTGNDLFDALYALALEEARENSVDEIRNGAFNSNQAVPCGDGGCFETGRLWTYVWTRDTAYAMDLGLADLDPVRARNSLMFKVSDRRSGGEPEIVQDTGSGGSYPVSTDRVVWAFGAWAVLNQLDGQAREDFVADAWEAVRNTVERDRVVAFDESDGLYTGETSFLDWREQTYPAWTEHDVIDIATSKALSTNAGHLQALRLAAYLATEVGESDAATRYLNWVNALEAAIRARFWDAEAGMMAAFVPSFLDPAPVRRWDLLGSALAVLQGVADEGQAARMLESYPTYGPGAPVIWPQQQRTRIYHNRAEWPFVTAYWLRAAARADNDAVANQMVWALARGAAVNLSNMENFEAGSGAAYLNDGTYSGPVVNSQRQLWSVAGYVSMVHRTLFGLEPNPFGFSVNPYVTVGLRGDPFAGTDTLVLNDWPFRGRTVTVVLHLPPAGGEGGSYEIGEVRLNGELLAGPVVTVDQLFAANRLDVELVAPGPGAGASMTVVSDADWRDVFGPQTPIVRGISEVEGGLALELEVPNEDTATFTLAVYRDGERVAEGLAGTTTSWTDTGADAAASPCYAVEATFTGSGNHSQHSRAACWWGAEGEHITSVPATDFEAEGGALSEEYGRAHYDNWGAPGHSLTVSGFAPTRTGPHLLQVVYGNGAGPINTGITCAVKRITVYDEADDSVVADGLLVMPQLGTWARWADSSFVRANLEAGRTYSVVIGDGPGAENMSSFQHFATYNGPGGADGPFDRVNIAELKVLAL